MLTWTDALRTRRRRVDLETAAGADARRRPWPRWSVRLGVGESLTTRGDARKIEPRRSMLTSITRKIDRRNLVRELAFNKVDALELLREALSNAKDHGARNVWFRSVRGAPPQQPIDLYLINDGSGLDAKQREAFWGVSTSIKPENQGSIGYKGHGTKLYFSARRLSVATRSEGDSGWRLASLDEPLESDSDQVEERPLPPDHVLAKEIRDVGLWDKPGVAVLIERCSFPDAPTRFLSRRTIESYCDWFTVIGDVRSGLFLKRADFHEAVANKKDAGLLRDHECPLRPLTVHLRINGERQYYPIGFGPKDTDARFLEAWREDADRWRTSDPGMAAFGHRFADHFASERGASQIRDDRTALCITTAPQFSNDSQYALIIRVEGRRRQLVAYQEGSRQPVGGEYDFNDRFGLWLCKDFVPIVRKNDWLQVALTTATERVKRRQRFELTQFRHWQIFINHQAFVLTANRNDVTNAIEHQHAVIELVAKRVEEALKENAFAEWIENLQRTVVGGKRDRELEMMRRRVNDVVQFINKEGA